MDGLTIAIKVAAVLFWINAAGFGMPVLPVVRHLLDRGELPIMFGFRAYGGPFFQRFGTGAFVWLLIAFLMVSIGEAAIGWLLWTGHHSGGILAIALLPIAAVFWFGLALPFPAISGLARTILVVLGWSSLLN